MFNSGFLATVVQLRTSNEAYSSLGAAGVVWGVELTFGDSLALLSLASSPLTLHICSSPHP